jgi:IS5 family transposase
MQDVLIIGLEHGPSDGAMRRAQYVGRWSARPRLRGVQCRHERVPESFRAQQKYLKTSAHILPLIRYPDWPSAQKCISLLRSASLQ